MSERRGTVMLIQRGDPEITGAIVEGMMAGRSVSATETSSVTGFAGATFPTGGRLSGAQIEVVQAEIDRQKILADLVRVATGNRNTPEDYEILITKARGDYQRLTRPAGPLRRFARRALGLYGLVVYSVATMGRGW